MSFRPALAGGITLTLFLIGCTTGATGPDEPSPAPSVPVTTAGPGTPAAGDPRHTDLDPALSRPQADSVYPGVGEPGIDALHQDLDLTWDPEAARLDGRQRLTFRATTDHDRFRLDFSAALDVKELTVDGAAADWSREGHKLSVEHPVTAEERYVLELEYGGTPEPVPAPTSRMDFDGVGLRATENGEAWTLQEPYGAFTWYALNDHPSDKALYDFTLTVPEPWTGVANGTLTSVTETDGQRTTTWHLPQPAASYLITVAFADYSSTELESASGVPITLYWLTRDPGSLGELTYAGEAMDWAEELLGPYPYDTFGAVVVDSASAMETQTMVTMGHTGYTLSRAVLVHELIHHWYGNPVSPADWSGMWMNEGMTMYLQWLWEAEHSGRTLDEIVDGQGRALADDLRERYGPPAAYDPDHFATSNVYYIPAVMWHELRGMVGDERFFAMTRAWPAERAGTSTDTADYLAWVEEFLDEDLSDFFDAWLFGDGEAVP
jgi:aminopeptidase N